MFCAEILREPALTSFDYFTETIIPASFFGKGVADESAGSWAVGGYKGGIYV